MKCRRSQSWETYTRNGGRAPARRMPSGTPGAGGACASAASRRSVTTFDGTASRPARRASSRAAAASRPDQDVLSREVRHRPATGQRHREVELGEQAPQDMPDAFLAAEAQAVDV